jgi:NADPH:quinone reductase-like Zn-dependent oxidoreductase
VERGKESVLEPREVPVPQPKAGEVVVRVHAAGLNRGELIVGSVVHGGAEKLGGTEAAGVIHAIGEGVTGWKVGDHVMGRARGTFAEYTPMLEGQIMRAPERFSWEQAAAIPSSFLTSYEAVVRYGRLQTGEWLLVAGASSGVGVGAILTAKVLGARTIATTTSPAKAEKLKAIGCDVVVDSRSADFAKQVSVVTGGGANLGVNLVGGSVFPGMLDALAYEGRIAIVGYVDNQYLSEIDLGTVHGNRLQIFGISNAKLPAAKRFETTRGFVRDILPALEDGRIAPVVDRVFAFDEMPAAKAYMESNAMVGKVIVKVAS